ncbi:MAG: CopG family transcriptional regulator [Alphaproteobacteria bacterium]|nr:CopG family transcriptional regulator [Alphaproteobacteria bacterium]
MNTLSFRTEDKIKQKLDTIAQEQNRDRSFVINQAIDYYLSLYDWQIEHIMQGVKQAQKQEFASDEEIKSAFAKWKKQC